MKAKVSFFLIFFLLILSCTNSSKECDCEKDCVNSEPIFVTIENSISSEALYNTYLKNVLSNVKSQLKDPNFGQLSEDEKERLKQALEHSKVNFNSKVVGGICPPCPTRSIDKICCNDFSFFVFNTKFDKIKLKNKTSLKTYTVGDQIIIPVKNSNGDIIVNSLDFNVLDYKGNQVDLNLNIN